ncbi:hypothetical protein GCM10027429_23430 [Marivirga atlantica]|jgi:hypothetical protein|uniref:Uncharacterized protein n=1 Tax=Marivirga atlantica TaxID=1548457 RepID=A0A937ALV8_9BACT|nr:hypothetical protein [Marivirga atlantica]MBL0765943.1 hypothetical protein [Marivirga atlantica]
MINTEKRIVQDYIVRFETIPTESETFTVHYLVNEMLIEDLRQLNFFSLKIEGGLINQHEFLCFKHLYKLYKKLFQSIKNKENEILNSLYVEDDSLNEKLYILRDILLYRPKTHKLFEAMQNLK